MSRSETKLASHQRRLVVSLLAVMGVIGLAGWGYHSGWIAQETPPPALSEFRPGPERHINHQEALPSDTASSNPIVASGPAEVVPPKTQTAGPVPDDPTIEPPDEIATTDFDLLREEVGRMDKELEERKAIERLNKDEVSAQERLELGTMIQRVALFRHRLLEAEVGQLGDDVARYEEMHAQRLAEFSKKMGLSAKGRP
jgi:hypothetical protein